MLASSKSLKLLPMLGEPSLPSLTTLRWRGDKADAGSPEPRTGDMGSLLELTLRCGCDCAEDEEECNGPIVRDGLGRVCFATRRVSLGSAVAGFAASGSENGKKGGESSSSSSSSASDKGPRGALEFENLGRRMYARLRDRGADDSDSDDDELRESSALLEMLSSLSRDTILGFGAGSEDFLEPSRAPTDRVALDGDSGSGQWPVGGEGLATWCTVLVEEVRDILFTILKSDTNQDAISAYKLTS